MNKIEKLHRDAIVQAVELAPDFGIPHAHTLNIAHKSAEVTEQVAIKFHNWMNENDTEQNAERFPNFSDKDMFQEFLKCNYDF